MNDKPISGLLGDFRLLLILFVAFRVCMLFAYQPFLLEGQERGLGTGGDRAYHFALSSLVAEDKLPFRDWWSEFPPLWYALTSTVYAFLGRQASYDTWSLALGVLLILAEAVSLWTIRRIGTRLHGQAQGFGLAWVYALLAVPFVFMWWNFDALLTCFTLLAMWAWLEGKRMHSAVWVALGALTKFVPLVWLGAIIRFDTPRKATQGISVALGAFALAYVPLFALNSDFALISLTAQFNKPSYQTVWALLDGNGTTGNFGSVESHFTAEGVRDGVADRNPARVPSWLRLGVALAIGVWVFFRTRRRDMLGAVAFMGIALNLFYLQSQGWSPQWLTLILPLLLLVFPTRNGVLVAVMLSLLAFVEYPFIFIRTGDTGGVLTAEHPLFATWVMVVMFRTLLLAGACVAFYGKLRQQPNPNLALVG